MCWALFFVSSSCWDRWRESRHLRREVFNGKAEGENSCRPTSCTQPACCVKRSLESSRASSAVRGQVVQPVHSSSNSRESHATWIPKETCKHRLKERKRNGSSAHVPMASKAAARTTRLGMFALVGGGNAGKFYLDTELPGREVCTARLDASDWLE